MPTFNPTTGGTQAWVTSEAIDPVIIPQPSISGSVRYNYTHLPEGVEINLASLVIYGAPTQVSSGTFVLTAIDDAGSATYTFDWAVIEYDEPIEWADADDLRAVIGQPLDFQLPVPTGGTPPYSYSIVDPATRVQAGLPLLVWPYEARLPQGITFVDGLFSGTPTDTPDNRGGIFWDGTVPVNVQAESGGDRRRTVANLGTLTDEQRTFTYDGTTLFMANILSRTRVVGAANVSTAPGGLRWRLNDGAGGNLIRLEDLPAPPRNNPFVRLTSADDPTLTSTHRVMSAAAGTGAFIAFWPSGITYPGSPLDAWAGAAQGDRWRIEFGTETRYPIIVEATDTLGASIRQTILVDVTAPDPDVPVPVLGDPLILSHALSVPLTAGILLDGTLQYAVTLRGKQPSTWLHSEFRGNIDALGLQFDTEYDLWARNVSATGTAGAATLLQFRTLFSGASVQAPAPANMTAEPLDAKARIRCDVAEVATRVINYEYQVVRASESLDPNGWETYPGSTGATSVFSIPGLINGVDWRIGLRQVNEAGPGYSNEIRVVPQAGAVDSGAASKIQFQVLLNLTAGALGGYPWFDIAPFVLDCVTDGGRANRQVVAKAGTATIRIENSSDFIDIEGDSPYRLDELNDRLVLINSVVELPAGNVRRRTDFAGIVDNAKAVRKGQYAYIEIKVIDRIGLLAQEEVVFSEPVPAQLTGERIKYLLDASGWTTTNSNDLRYYNPDLIAEGSKMCAELPVEAGSPITLNLLDEINLTAISDGGRIFIGAGGDNRPGDLRFLGASPVTQIDGRIQDVPSPNPATIRVHGQPKTEAEDSVLYNDFELAYPGATEPKFASDQASIETWGKRTYKQEVRTDELSTEALIRSLLKQYKIPRRWVSALPVKAHFQTPIGAALLQDLDLSKSYRTEYTPPGASVPIVEIQRIDGFKTIYEPGDRQHCQKTIMLRLLVPEADVYWILEEEGADAYDRDETFLAPRRDDDPPLMSLGGRIPGGFRTSDDKEYQVMSANRFNALISQQSFPRYSSEEERDRIEGDPGTPAGPVHNQKCEIVEIDENGVRHIYISQYSGPDFQWIRVAALTTADANPTFRTLVFDDAVRGVLDDSNIWDEGVPVTDLRSWT